MKISTSYFYQIRFFKPNMIPVSTARFDPSWFKSGIDKNGVINGIRLNIFAPDDSCGAECQKNCNSKPSNCKFLRKYREQLSKFPLERVLLNLDRIADYVEKTMNISKDDIHIVFIVYEDPRNSCSERSAIQEYFRSNGIECDELEYPLRRD